MTMMRIRGVWTTNLAAFLLGAGMYASFIVFPQFALLALAHNHPYAFLIAAALLGVGIGLAFAALRNLIVQAVSPQQTGVASGMNTVMRTLGGALGGQLLASFIAAHTLGGQPAVTGFTETFLMATGFLVVCFLAGLLVPKGQSAQAAIDTPQASAAAGVSGPEVVRG